MILADTNIFLEILLDQEKKEQCKQFISENIENICLSDFSFHSIGLILFRANKQNVFTAFVEDILDYISIVSLSKINYLDMERVNNKFGLDFDDAYQYCVVKENHFEIATSDKDFHCVEHDIPVRFI